MFLNNSSVYDHLSRFYFGHAPWIFLSFLCESLYVTTFRVVLERRGGEADHLSGTHFRIGCWIGRRLCSLRRMKASALCETHTDISQWLTWSSHITESVSIHGVRAHEGLFAVSSAVTQSDHWNPPTGPAQRSAVFRLTLWSNNWGKDSSRRRSRGAVFMVSGFQLKACVLSSREMPRAPVSSLPVVTSAVCPAHRGPS